MIKIATLLICLFSAAAQAYGPLTDDNRNDYVAPDEWREHEVNIPETFNAKDLQPFSLKGSGERFEYAIERGSLRTGKDGVTRFVVVIRSSQNAVNSSYEGLRCGHREHKVYAYGGEQTLTPMPGAQWQPIPRDSSDYRAVLYQDLICNLLTGQPNPPKAVFQAMSQDRQVDSPFITHGHE